jgi:hypothetical protein
MYLNHINIYKKIEPFINASIHTKIMSKVIFKCTVCCEDLTIGKKNKVVTCEQCDYSTCNHCQKQYAQPYCMNCKSLFTKSQILSLLGLSFVKNVIHKNKINELIETETILISSTSELIKWEKDELESKRLFRRGMVLENHNPIRPVIGNDPVRNCTTSSCSGILKHNYTTDITACILCNKEHCIKCIEPKEDDHICDKQILANLQDIKDNTKPCPRCVTNIYKTMGCSHMHCTKCNVHFDWITGNILASSTNVHYRQNGQDGTRLPNENNGTCIDHILTDSEHVPIDVLLPIIPDHNKLLLQKLLYDDACKIRKHSIKEYNNNQINSVFRKRNDDLRIKYINKTISEKVWGRHLFNNNQLLELKLECAKILEVYIESINKIQSDIFNKVCTSDSAISQILELLTFCNTCFHSVNDHHYCGAEHTFKFSMPGDNSGLPMIRITDTIKNINLNILPDNTPSIINDIVLRDYQLAHYKRITNILHSHPYAIDLSPLGSGKTYISSKYIQDNNFKSVFIICPASLKAKWLSVTREHNVVAYILTYNEITSVKYVQPKHGLLIRDDFTGERRVNGYNQPIDIVNFRQSKEYTTMLNNPSGVLLIFDEIQNIRIESSNRTRACRELMSGVLNTFEKGNKIIMISGTPFDKGEQYLTFFRNINVLNSNIFQYNPHTNRNDPRGYCEIQRYCRCLDEERKYTQILRDCIVATKRESAIVFIERLFLNIIMKYCSSQMPITDVDKCTVLNINSFCDLGDDNALSEQIITKLMKVFHNHDNLIIQDVRMKMFESLMLLESVKINTIVKYARQVLESHPNNKVVVSVNYTDSIERLMTDLSQYSPLLLSGKLSPKCRSVNIDNFQLPTNDHRLIIGNLRVMSCGIDLDDKDGNYPRHVFVSPSFSAIDLHQFSFRFVRSTDTKSNTIIRHIFTKNGIDIDKVLVDWYSINNTEHPSNGVLPIIKDLSTLNHHNQEQKILKYLSNKGQIMKNISSEDTEFANDFIHEALISGKCL